MRLRESLVHSTPFTHFLKSFSLLVLMYLIATVRNVGSYWVSQTADRMGCFRAMWSLTSGAQKWKSCHLAAGWGHGLLSQGPHTPCTGTPGARPTSLRMWHSVMGPVWSPRALVLFICGCWSWRHPISTLSGVSEILICEAGAFKEDHI